MICKELNFQEEKKIEDCLEREIFFLQCDNLKIDTLNITALPGDDGFAVQKYLTYLEIFRI